jgi:hypothetical protein
MSMTCHKQSAEGAKYDSQGQARSEAKRVAPGKHTKIAAPRPERPKYSALSGLGALFIFYQGRRASRLPLAFISRAVGAVTPAVGAAIR